MSRLYEIFGDNAHAMTKALMEAADVAAQIPAGADVALKPNLVVGASAESGATTHGGVLSGAIEYLRDHGFGDVSIIEGSWVGDDTMRAFHTCGYDKIGEHYGVPLYDLKKDKTRKVDTPFGPMDLCCRALDAGYLINLPVLKGHCQTVMTCALKNLKGCIPDREKRRFHAEGLMKPIAALGSVLKPDLIIVDSICGDLNFEEGGTPIQTNRMLLGTDGVQIDAYGCTLMGLKQSEVPYIGLAEQWGAGCSQLGEGDLVRINEPTAGAAYPRPTGTVAGLIRNVREDSACSACFASLVRALYTSGKLGRRGVPIAIGQGWKDKDFDGLGVGRCCNCAKVQVKGCPPTADEITKVLDSMG
ncbi:MAG: DUF362 domain-containing protein [Clostridia bacterium]|nr:DUF362 domain-containing protein [Clostridia bacterium]